LEAYSSAIETASKLVDPNLKPDAPDWRQNAALFFAVRWGELEMVGPFWAGSRRWSWGDFMPPRQVRVNLPEGCQAVANRNREWRVRTLGV
jgi:hypothetical protein